jgi:hypothetical protein
LTEIYLCHACSYHEIEDGNGAPGRVGTSAEGAGVRRRGAAGLGTTSSWQRRETRRCTLRWPRSRWWCDRLQGIACMHYFAAQHCAAWSNTYKNSLMFTNRFGLRRELGLGLWYCRYLLAVLPCRCHLDERVRDHSVREHVLLLPFDHPWVTLLAQARGGGGDRIVILARDGIGSRWRGRACLLLRGALRCTPNIAPPVKLVHLPACIRAG